MSSPLVLLIHGVNSTGEWHDTTVKECHGLFECVPIKYRYYHGLSGPLKVYAWPAGLSLFLAVGAFLLLEDPRVRLGIVLGILALDSVVAALAERAWVQQKPHCLLPFLYLALGCATALFLGGNARLVFPLAAITATCLYLDVREYGHPSVSVAQAWLVSVLVFGVAAWGILWLLEQSSTRLLVWALAGLAVLTVVEPYARRGRAFHFVRGRIREARKRDPYPHVVAHSLGTYLTGHLLNEEDRLFVGRVIFTGCVLDRDFPWHQNVGAGTPQKCWAVKNYVGGLDPVPVVTGLLRVVWVTVTLPARVRGVGNATQFLGDYVRWRPLGWAGQRGFRDRPAVVHSQDSDTVCGQCLPAGVSATVHNVRSRFAGHSTLNQDPDYQCFQWLPFLWVDSPDKFDYWKEVCRIGNQAATALEGLDPDVLTPELLENQNTLRDAEQWLLQGPWYWLLNPTRLGQHTPVVGRPLDKYVEEILAKLPAGPGPGVAAIMRRIPLIIFKKFAQALAEKELPNPRPEITALLEPRKVLFAAVCDAINLGP